MLRISPAQLIKAAQLSTDVGGNSEVDGSGGGHETFEKSPTHTKVTIKAMDYLNPKAKVAFIKLRKAFTKAPIFCYFNPEYSFRIETNVFGYAITRVLS